MRATTTPRRAPLPEISPAWSPMASFGGYQQASSGASQARTLIDAAAESALQAVRRERAA